MQSCVHSDKESTNTKVAFSAVRKMLTHVKEKESFPASRVACALLAAVRV